MGCLKLSYHEKKYEPCLKVAYKNFENVPEKRSKYYPSGLVMSGISSKALNNAPANKYKYNGKEEQRQEFSDCSGLEWLDYGARMYENQIGRWMTIDPMCETSVKYSGFTYVANNPLKYTDPTGCIIEDPLDKKNNKVEELKERMKVARAKTGFEPIADWFAKKNKNGTISMFQLNGNTASTYYSSSTDETYFNVGGDNLTASQAESNANSMLSYGIPWATIGGTLTSIASHFYFNSKGWYSYSQNKFYGHNFWGNQYTAGGKKAAKATSVKLTRIGYGLGVWNAYDINNQYQNGEISQGQMVAEQGTNVISTFGGIYGAAWGVGWELGRAVTSIPWYRANIRPLVQDLIGVERYEDRNRELINGLKIDY